jgi:class 3 adenylate cyclase
MFIHTNSVLIRSTLDLLAKIITYEVKHKPGYRLRLRMGMHSGSVVGGMVGSRVPHYSILGWVIPSPLVLA